MATLVIDNETLPDELDATLSTVDGAGLEDGELDVANFAALRKATDPDWVEPDIEINPEHIYINPDDYPDTTAYLNAIPGMAEYLTAMRNAPASAFKPAPRKYFNV